MSISSRDGGFDGGKNFFGMNSTVTSNHNFSSWGKCGFWPTLPRISVARRQEILSLHFSESVKASR